MLPQRQQSPSPRQKPRQDPAQPKKSNDFLVFITRNEDVCTDCGEEFGSGNWIFLEEGKPLCMHHS